MPKKIDEQLKTRAVRLVTEHQQEYPSLKAATVFFVGELDPRNR